VRLSNRNRRQTLPSSGTNRIEPVLISSSLGVAAGFGDDSSILASLAANKPAVSSASTATTAAIRRVRSDLWFRLFVRCFGRRMSVSQN